MAGVKKGLLIFLLLLSTHGCSIAQSLITGNVDQKYDSVIANNYIRDINFCLTHKFDFTCFVDELAKFIVFYKTIDDAEYLVVIDSAITKTDGIASEEVAARMRDLLKSNTKSVLYFLSDKYSDRNKNFTMFIDEIVSQNNHFDSINYTREKANIYMQIDGLKLSDESKGKLRVLFNPKVFIH